MAKKTELKPLEKKFPVLIVSLVGSLILFAISMVDGNRISTAVLGIIVIIFAISVIVEQIGKK